MPVEDGHDGDVGYNGQRRFFDRHDLGGHGRNGRVYDGGRIQRLLDSDRTGILGTDRYGPRPGKDQKERLKHLFDFFGLSACKTAKNQIKLL